jgi:preprotein translocase subunit SecE
VDWQHSRLYTAKSGRNELLKSCINGRDIVAKKNEAESEAKTTGFNISTFFQETKDELNKVVWPSRQQLLSESAAVLLMVTLSAVLIYLVDGFFAWAAKQVFG